jgi:DNA polymerase III subunit epsilon
MFTAPLVVLDFETTGLAPEQGDRITEVGMVRIEGHRVVDRFQSLVNCGVKVPRSISVYTGITQQMVDDAPPVAHVLRQMAVFADGAACVAHNARLDQRFALAEYRRLRIRHHVEPFICSMRLARHVYPQLDTHSLAALALALKLKWSGPAHRAAADAELTADLVLRLGADLAARYPGEKLSPRWLRRLSASGASSPGAGSGRYSHPESAPGNPGVRALLPRNLLPVPAA